jgi:glucose-1-phosphatase
MKFKNLIFDLGGVIIDLSVSKTLEGFSRISGYSPEYVTEVFKDSEGFEKYERGEYSDDEFRAFVREIYNINVKDEDIDACWNAMLLGVPDVKLQLLTRLKKKYPTFLLSNTNTIHLNYINSTILPPSDTVPSLDSYFHGSYYSHFMGKRKPEPGIFIKVIEENNLRPEETLFLDDNPDNIAGARAVGLQTAFVNTPDFILNYFHE